MKINLPYPLRPAEVTETTSQQRTYDIVMSAIHQKHKDGLEGQMRRIVGRIQRKFEEAIDSSGDTVELEAAEMDLVKKSFDEAKYPASWSKLVDLVEDELDNGIKDA